MEIHAADINAKVQSEIDEITSRMIDVEQQLFAAQNENNEVTMLQEEVAMLQTERKAIRLLLERRHRAMHFELSQATLSVPRGARPRAS